MIGTVINIAFLLLKVANGLFNHFRDQGLIRAGEDRQIAKQVEALERLSQTLREVEEEYAQKTDEEIMKDLEGDFRD